jgi:hypothetical protein
MITTGFQTQLVPMPICRYEILDAADGQIVQFAIIGMPVFHKWTCDTDTVDTFCMTVHSCFVDDGAGDRLDLIDEGGCAIDKYLMGNLDYPSDLMGVKEVHVFKYADRPALQFQCQITILVKEPNGQCIRPTCAAPGGRGDGSRRQRRAVINEEGAAGTMDVASEFSTLDISTTRQHLPNESRTQYFDRPVMMSRESSEGICMSTGGLTTMLILAVVLVVACVTVAAVVIRK